jgi:hypothetical protein
MHFTKEQIMKKVSIFLIFIFFSTVSFGQLALSFKEAKEEGVSHQKLDSIYLSGVHANPELGVFNENMEEFVNAYHSLLKDFGKFLKANGFQWEKPTKAFNRIYFSSEGNIDYFLYYFNKGQLTDEQETRFGSLLNEFIKDYQFPLKADVGFAQCSPVTYMPSEAAAEE